MLSSLRAQGWVCVCFMRPLPCTLYFLSVLCLFLGVKEGLALTVVAPGLCVKLLRGKRQKGRVAVQILVTFP